jgi:hypothetical protein
MFPEHDSIIIRNEAGEPLGWDKPTDPMDYYCDACGFSHMGDCPPDPDEDEDDEG